LDVVANFPAVRYADLHLEPGQQFPAPGYIVTPGSYVGTVTLKRDSVLRLGAGRYYFDTLDVQAGGILRMDHTGGHTEVWVRNSMAFQGSIVSDGGNQYANLFVFVGQGTVHVNEAFRGTLVAPHASLNMANRLHYGAFYAGGGLELHQGGAIHHRPLVCTP
jgi:hypothetical protein